MNESSKLVKVASILNIIFGMLLIKIPFYREILLITGFILFVFSTEEIHYKNRKNILKIAIVLIPFNFLSAAILLFANDKIDSYRFNVNGINAPPKNFKPVDKEAKKIDILLKLGIGMIFTSGILFVTTSWDFISNPIKAFTLILFGLIFLALSAFSEKRLNIYKTTYTYWLLSMIFFLLAIVGIEYFGVFGNYLTYNGLGKHLAYTITYLVAAGLTFATYLKFPKNYLIYLVYISITSAIYTLLRHCGISALFVVLLISITTTILNIILKKDTTLGKYSDLLSYVLLPLYCLNLSNETNTLIFATGLVNICNHYFILYSSKESQSDYLSLVISHIFLFVAIYSLDIQIDISNLIVAFSLTANIVLLKFNIIKASKFATNLNYIFYSLSILIIYLSNFYSNNDMSMYISLLISLIYLLATIISSRNILSLNETASAKYTEPLAILLTIISLRNLDFLQDIFTGAGIIILTTSIYTFIHILAASGSQKNIYLFAIYLGTIISLLSISVLQNFEAILVLIPSVYLFYTAYSSDKHSNTKLGFTYIILMATIYCLFNVTNILNLSSITSAIILILILIVIILLVQSENIRIISYILITIPLLDIVNEIDFNSSLRSVMISLIILYITFLLVKFIFKTKDSKNVFAIIGIIISLSNIFFEPDILTGLYVGIVGLSVLMIGYKSKELGPLFQTGIIITVINIIYKLNQLWGEIPFWLYLLIGGFSIIIFVTYKEFGKIKEK